MTPSQYAWLALALAAALAASGGAVVCPTLEVAPAAEVINLTAATYNTTPFQTLAYNSTKWGPLLRLTLGKLYQINVENIDIEGGTSVHWHGQRQFNTSWSDGVAPLTQAPTPAGSTFQYRFVAEPAGTYWYHSHTSEQYGDGLRGPLVVEDPDDPQAGLYDEDEHLLLLADVFPETLTQQLDNLETKGMAMGGGCPYQDISDAPYYAIEVNGESFNTTGQAAVFNVSSGKRYRFRTIAGTSSFGLQVAVEGHDLSLIAVDGEPIEPTAAKAFRVTPGERVDFVLTADQAVANYFINITTVNGMNSPAILHYEGAPDPATDQAVSADAYDKDLTCAWGLGGQPGVVDLKNASLQASPSVPPPPQESTKQFTVYLANPAKQPASPEFMANALFPDSPYGLPAEAAASLSDSGSCPGGLKYCWSLNWNVFAEPETLPIYPLEFEPLNRTYWLEVEQGDVVDVAFVNPTPMIHPMHLHGAAFWVLASGNGQILDDEGRVDPSKVQYNLQNPILRDNIPVPQVITLASPAEAPAPSAGSMGDGMRRRLRQMGDGMGESDGEAAGVKSPGYSIVRFEADNPGIWSFHCHIDLHAVAGMFLYIKVLPPGGAPWYAPENLQCSE